MSGSTRLEQKRKETSKEKVTVEAAAPQELKETSSSLGSLIDIVWQVLNSCCAHVTRAITVLILRFYHHGR